MRLNKVAGDRRLSADAADPSVRLATTTVQPGAQASVAAECPSGTAATGGGFPNVDTLQRAYTRVNTSRNGLAGAGDSGPPGGRRQPRSHVLVRWLFGTLRPFTLTVKDARYAS